MGRQRSPKPHNRDGIWYLVRRVPKEFRPYDNRPAARISTDIRVADDPRAVRATPAVAALDRELHAYWRGKREGRDDEAKRRFDEARERAKKFELPYRTADELAAGPMEEILRRVNLLVERGNIDDDVDAAGILGGEDRPQLMVGAVLAEFEAIESEALRKMSANQRRKAHATRNRSLNNFIEAIGGDKTLSALRRDDGVKFRIALQGRVASGAIDIGSANREMGAVSKMLKTVDLQHQLNLPSIFEDLRIKGETDTQRLPFSSEWITTKILAAGALDGLNPEARDIIYLLIDHGMRPSEVHDCLVPGTIMTDAKVPHVRILPVEKILKTPHSERDIPLVGSGVEIMERRPGGFPRYRGKDAFSAAVNKYFRENGLMETPKHTVYGLRHSFEDRLTAVEAPEKVVAALMGHRWHRPRYGKGPTLEQKQRWLALVSLT